MTYSTFPQHVEYFNCRFGITDFNVRHSGQLKDKTNKQTKQNKT